MEAVGTFVISVYCNETTRRYIPEDSSSESCSFKAQLLFPYIGTVLTFLWSIVQLYSTECLIVKCINSSGQIKCILSPSATGEGRQVSAGLQVCVAAVSRLRSGW
jgi:hypothetical protein